MSDATLTISPPEIAVKPATHVDGHDPSMLISMRNIWKTYQMLCERISSGALKRDLVFEVMGTEGCDQAKLIYCVSKLKKYCRHIIIRTALDEKDFRKFDGFRNGRAGGGHPHLWREVRP